MKEPLRNTGVPETAEGATPFGTTGMAQAFSLRGSARADRSLRSRDLVSARGCQFQYPLARLSHHLGSRNRHRSLSSRCSELGMQRNLGLETFLRHVPRRHLPQPTHHKPNLRGMSPNFKPVIDALSATRKRSKSQERQRRREVEAICPPCGQSMQTRSSGAASGAIRLSVSALNI